MTRAPIFTKAVSEFFRVICAFCVQGYRGNRLFIGLLVWILGCTDSTDPADIAQYRFQEEISSQILHVRIADESVVGDAEALRQSAEARWLIGRPVRGDGGFNTGWTWHLDPATISFAEVTIEACQSAAGAVGDDLDYWIGFGQVCVWGVVQARER